MMYFKNKKNVLTILSVVLIMLLSIGVMFASNGPRKTNAEYRTDIDLEVAKNKEPLKANRSKFKQAKKELVLDVSWGNQENQFGMNIYQEAKETPVVYETPTIFAVGPNGEIFVDDIVNNKIKVFMNNELVRQIDVPVEDESQPFVLIDSDVDKEGNLWGLNYLANELVKIGIDGQIVKISSDFEAPQNIYVLSNDKIMIRDNVYSENATRVRKFNTDGETLSENKLASLIDFSLYEFENKKGDIIKIAPIGYRNHQIELIQNETGESLGICNLSSMPVEEDTDSNNQLLGTDANGLVYFWVQDIKIPTSDKVNDFEGNEKLKKEYIVRIDIQKNTAETMSIDRTDISMNTSIIGSCNRSIKIDKDGNVYQLEMNKKGYSVWKYRF